MVNPTVLANCGLPFESVAFATAITAIAGAALAGFFGNLPVGLAPGMGLNAYFAYGVCVAKGFPYQAALAIVLLMGLLFALLSALGVCSTLQRVMPDNLKHATTVAIGIFQAFIGFRMVGLVVGDAHTLVALGDVPRRPYSSASSPPSSSARWSCSACRERCSSGSGSRPA